VVLRSTDVGNGRITGAQRLMDGGSIPPSSTIVMSQVIVDIFNSHGDPGFEIKWEWTTLTKHRFSTTTLTR
jgi:hypothetical protein